MRWKDICRSYRYRCVLRVATRVTSPPFFLSSETTYFLFIQYMQWLNQLCPFCENRKERLKNEDLYTWLVVVGVAVVHLEAQAAVDAGLWSTRVQVDENLGVAQSSTTTVTRHLKQVTLSYLLPIISRVFLPCKGLWIRNHFLRIRIQQFFSMRLRIQLHFKCGSGLDPDPASKTMWKKQKVAQK